MQALFRDARREDVPEIVALLVDDVLGAGREGRVDDAYLAAFAQIEADPRTRLLVAEIDGLHGIARRAEAPAPSGVMSWSLPGSAAGRCRAFGWSPGHAPGCR